MTVHPPVPDTLICPAHLVEVVPNHVYDLVECPVVGCWFEVTGSEIQGITEHVYRPDEPVIRRSL